MQVVELMRILRRDHHFRLPGHRHDLLLPLVFRRIPAASRGRGADRRHIGVMNVAMHNNLPRAYLRWPGSPDGRAWQRE